ncbi:hypothetical protein [Silvanigrella aquatica]|uniref:Uncharacterized protein n=1 Tax=Silvanigrella aquatica TaxID=1915309 RepID=A0A1L4D3D0_9BACT|nr:hypothetical protein [Silvanigrella aquatica]APJ04709.1 hypothetical protein AXG55_12680 [Silvanigrella aquatica]
MEYLLSKIYSDPVYSSKSLSTFQLGYFYDYFKFECHASKTFSNRDCLKDKKQAVRIYKIIRHELKKRSRLGLDYQQIH